MGDRVLYNCSFAQRGAAALGFDLGAELVLERFVFTDRQASALAALGSSALRSLWTYITGAGGKLGVFAWDHRHGVAPRTGDMPMGEVEGEGVLRKVCPALWPGAGNDIHTLFGPLRHAWAGHVSQVDIELQQPWGLLQRLDEQLHRFMLWLVRGADHNLTGHMTIQVQHEVFLKAIERFGAALTAVPHVHILNRDAPIRGHLLLDARAPRATVWVWFGVLRDNLGDRVHDVLQGRSLLHKALVLLQPRVPAIDLFQHHAQRLRSSLWLPPVEVQRSLEAAVAHQDQARFLQNRFSRRTQFPRREAHRLAHRMPKQVQGVLHAPSPKQGRGVQGGPQLPGAKAPGLLGQGDGTLQQDFVQVMGHEPHTKVAQRALAEGRLLGAKAIQHHLPALVHHREFHGVSVTHVTIGLQQGGEDQHTGFHRLFAARLRTIGLGQSVLERGIQQLMPVLAQKHKEFSRLACACSNFLFFQGQRNRWVPHSGLLQMGGVCSSATYKSTEPPVVSTLSELLSKQLISVLAPVPNWPALPTPMPRWCLHLCAKPTSSRWW